MKPHPTPLQVITTRSREGGPKEHRAKQKWPRETQSVTCAPRLSTLSYISRIVAQPPPSFIYCPRPPSHHPSNQTSIYPYSTSAYFRHQPPSGSTVHIHSCINENGNAITYILFGFYNVSNYKIRHQENQQKIL